MLKNDKNNWRPRIGFTYDLTGRRQPPAARRLRASSTTSPTPTPPSSSRPPRCSRTTASSTTYHDPNGIQNADGTFFQPGQPLPPNQLTGGGASAPNEVASPTLATPVLRPGLARLLAGRSTTGSASTSRRSRSTTATCRSASAPTRLDPTATRASRRFPQFGNFRIWYGKRRGQLRRPQHRLPRAATKKFELQGFYTYSATDGNVLAGADEFRLTDAGHQPDSGARSRRCRSTRSIPLCSACFGPLDTDARHRVTFAGTYRAPLGHQHLGHLPLPLGDALHRPRRPDLNGDGFTHRPGAGRLRTSTPARGYSFSQFDLRIGKQFNFAARAASR